jgi:hypothetical protein
MRYKEMYDLLEQRRRHVPGFSYTDYSGWRTYPPTYIDMARPLWIVAEDPAAQRRIWITQSGPDMRVSICSTDPKNGGRQIVVGRCKRKSDLADILRHLFEEQDQRCAVAAEQQEEERHVKCCG